MRIFEVITESETDESTVAQHQKIMKSVTRDPIPKKWIDDKIQEVDETTVDSSIVVVIPENIDSEETVRPVVVLPNSNEEEPT